MADDERGEKRSLRAKWRDRRAHRAERAAQKSEGRAALWAARNQADGVARTNSGSRVPRP
jgi:hypothetical protein